MTFWSGYGRDVRAGGVYRIWVRRARCRWCRSSHGLLPSFCLVGRLDSVEVIGPALKAVAAGRGTRSVAAGLGPTFPYTTVRGWWRRYRKRVAVLGPAGAVVAPETAARLLSTVGAVGVWPAVSLSSGGRWLAATTTNTPTTASSEGFLMAVMGAGRSRVPP